MANKRIPIEEINKRLPIGSKLLAIEYIDSHRSNSGVTKSKVTCRCSCGNTRDCVVSDLIRGNPKSCSECRKDKVRSNLLVRWRNMCDRCYNPSCKSYKSHGAKGVRVCDEWLNDFECFYKWSLENGYSVDLELDKDILGDGKLYSPATCKWVTNLENMSNRMSSVKYEYQGKLLTIPEISRITGILQGILKSRVKRGMTIEEAINDNKISYKIPVQK